MLSHFTNRNFIFTYLLKVDYVFIIYVLVNELLKDYNLYKAINNSEAK